MYFSQPVWAHPRNLTGSNRGLRKDKRQIWRKLGSGGLDTLMETHNNLDYLQKVYYIWGSMTLQLSGTGGTCNHNSLHINILRKAAVLHFALTSSAAGGCAKRSLQMWLCLCYILIGFLYSAVHIHSHMYRYIYIYVQTYVCMHIYIHINTHTQWI
jgi:hypothetical protein